MTQIMQPIVLYNHANDKKIARNVLTKNPKAKFFILMRNYLYIWAKFKKNPSSLFRGKLQRMKGKMVILTWAITKDPVR